MCLLWNHQPRLLPDNVHHPLSTLLPLVFPRYYHLSIIVVRRHELDLQNRQKILDGKSKKKSAANEALKQKLLS